MFYADQNILKIWAGKRKFIANEESKKNLRLHVASTKKVVKIKKKSSEDWKKNLTLYVEPTAKGVEDRTKKFDTIGRTHWKKCCRLKKKT